MYNKFVQVILNSISKSTDQIYTYAVPVEFDTEITRGKRVKVKFGNNRHLLDALVVNVTSECSIPLNKVKPIVDVLDSQAIISDSMIKLLFWMRERYISRYSDVVKLMVPSLMKYENSIYVEIINSQVQIDSLSLNHKEITLFNIIKDKKIEINDIKKLYKKDDIFLVLDSLKNKNIISVETKDKSVVKNAYEKLVSLASEDVEKESKIKNTLNQKSVIDYLKTKKEASVETICSELGIPKSIITNMIKKEVLKESYAIKSLSKTNRYLDEKNIVLNEEQEKVANEIFSSEDKIYLLHGVTGSGKTEVYIKVIEEYIKQNKQSIMLVPEISLTAQTIERFEKKFKDRIAVFHSKLNKNEKFIQWNRVYNKEVDVIIGARSAIFAPLRDLGVIIIDEEHEDSYVSSTTPKYDTIEVAIKLAQITNCKVILGSATPSLNTYYMALSGHIRKLELNKRVNNAKLPDIKIVNMISELDKGNNTIISELLYQSIKDSLAKKEQIILFLNKRGYSGFVHCTKCGHVARCDRCDVSMTYHLKGNVLKCHYCGKTKKIFSICPKCNSDKIEQFNAGTQHVEKLVTHLFPNARIQRMDMDSMTNNESYLRVYNDFKNLKTDILIGTQMLAKGFDFPNVTTVGVLAADAILNLPFYNANEKTFQLLTQVSGRAGRGDKKGKVYIQSYEPENFTIQSAKQNDYIGFINEELKLRKEFAFPPFINIINVSIMSKDEELAIKVANDKYEELKLLVNDIVEKRGLLLYRPIPNAIYKIKDEYRINLFIKSSNNSLNELRKILRTVYMMDDIENIRISININTDMI